MRERARILARITAPAAAHAWRRIANKNEQKAKKNTINEKKNSEWKKKKKKPTKYPELYVIFSAWIFMIAHTLLAS